ncbi:hypothetical protein EDD29_6719 [Actinocorallia herbida]|uniref:Collagen triple helix repeat protein n=1 Tax=Actinocorallia herbida TaxID=58109 RepID=A0A3N1D666_9ACTN|nr:hypothetical protein [Actinocorallia herbida]ROO89032.1 hypothetical protein EDD29_6719 [Actinocorallia herbida]
MKTARTAAAAVLLALLAGAAPAHAAPGPPTGASDGLVSQLTEIVDQFFCTIFDNCPKTAQGKGGKGGMGGKGGKGGKPGKGYKPGEHYDPSGNPYKPKKRDAGELPGYGPSPWTWPYDSPVIG